MGSIAPVTDKDAVKVDQNNIIKLEKMPCSKFNGVSLETLPQWKREFEAWVMVSGRSNIEIGGN